MVRGGTSPAPTASARRRTSSRRRSGTARRSAWGRTATARRLGAVGEALIVVDFQNDFTPGGALAVPDGDAIGDRVRELTDSGRFDLVVATRDWHPPDHGSFSEHGGIWPPHCVAGTQGAEI